MASHPPAFFHPSLLALPLGELSPKVTERACRAGPMCPAVNYRPPPCHVIPRRPAGPTWARHQPPGLPNARSLCVRLESASPSESPPPTDLALPLGELSPKVTERACRGFRFSLSVGCADSSPKGGAKGQRGNGVSAVPRLNLILPTADSQPPAPPRPRPPGPNSPDPGATSWRSPGTLPPGRSAWPIPRPAAGENYPMRWPPGG